MHNKQTIIIIGSQQSLPTAHTYIFIVCLASFMDELAIFNKVLVRWDILIVHFI